MARAKYDVALAIARRRPVTPGSRSAKWPATHERTARAGGALFSPRVRPAGRRANPVAGRAPSRPRQDVVQAALVQALRNLVSALRAGRPGRLALPLRPQPDRR